MSFGFYFFFNSILLGIGLAMDAFSVSLANGLNEPAMTRKKMCTIAGVFGFFQALMPMAGWICVHTIVQVFHSFEKLIPWIALILLCYIGGKMVYDSIKHKDCECEECPKLTIGALMIQGVATSIDALSVGFTIAEYDFAMALAAVILIGAVTFAICYSGLLIGKTVGNKIAGRAGVFGGVILIFIGIEIFVTSFF